MMVSDQACGFQMGLRGSMLRSLIGLRSGMSVSDGSPMKHVQVSNGSPIKHAGLQCVSDQSMSVSNGSPIKACRSPMGLRKVSNNNNIFMNSKGYCTTETNVDIYFDKYLLCRVSCCRFCFTLYINI